jgi:hypothetical protein
MRSRGLMADIQKPVADSIGHTGKEGALEPPVREKNRIFIFRIRAGEHVPEIIPLQQTGFDPAKIAGIQAIRFLQYGRCPALRALVADEKIRAFHRTGCNKEIQACFRRCIFGRPGVSAYFLPDFHSEDKISRWASDFYRSLYTA